MSVDTEPAAPAEVEPVRGELVRQEGALAVAGRPTRDVLMPLDTRQVVDGMKAYQRLLHELLEPSDWQPSGDGRFLKKSGWRKIARAFNLSLERVDSGVEYDPEDGRTPIRAWASYRAIAPNGQTQDGDGYCSLSEFVGKRRTDSKLENTMRGTATTRAKNRAISDLVGMGEVSAEEVTATDPAANTAQAGPPFGEQASPKLEQAAANAVQYLYDPDDEDPEFVGTLVSKAMTALEKDSGYLPRAVARAVGLVAATMRAAREAPQGGQEGSESVSGEVLPPAPAAAEDRREEPPGIGDDEAPEPEPARGSFDPVSQSVPVGEKSPDEIPY